MTDKRPIFLGMRNESSPAESVGMDLVALGQELISLRASVGWSQQVAATKAGISSRALCAYETGKTSPRIETLERLATLYGVTLAEIFRSVEAA